MSDFTNDEMFKLSQTQTQELSQTEIKEDSKLADLSKQGYAFLKENKINEAEEVFEKILSLEENNNYALVGLGDCERKKKHWEAAIEKYTNCLSFHPGNNYALFGLADCYKSLNQYKKAIEIWEQYLLYDDRNITVLTRVADVYRKLRDFKKSKELYKKALDMESDNSYALIGLGHLHYDFKEYQDALFYWTKMKDLHCDACDIRILTSIGNCHRKLKTYEEGIPYFEEALKLDPKNFYALFGLADCYRGLNQQFRSIEYWNRILELDPTNKVILTRAGDAYRNSGDYKTATDYYNRTLEIAFDTYAALGLALICKGEGRYEDACKKLLTLIKNDPKNYRLYIDLADCYVKLNQKDDALRLLSDFQKTNAHCQPIASMIEKIKTNKPLY